MKIRFHPYELRPGPDPVFAASAPRHGALLEATDDDGVAGHADLHPWPEFGHAPLSDHLASLAAGTPTPLAALALRHARTDAAARRAGVSLFDGLPPVRSHKLFTSTPDLLMPRVEQCANHGCTFIKLKIGRNPVREAAALNALASIPIRWRLDANALFTPDSAAEFLRHLSPEARSRIAFLEDPCTYAPDAWTALANDITIPLALDWQLPPSPPPWPGAKVLVIKPSSQEAFPLALAAAQCGMEIVVTHSMDHPLGRATALWTAMRLRQRHGDLVGDGGLDGAGLYETDGFAEAWNESAPLPIPPGGTGFGFDNLLRALAWRPLS